MRIIIFGLGNFGASLAINLSETGNEVIGVDKQMNKVNIIKDKITHAICMDATIEQAYNVLPTKEADLVVIAIGENEGAAIITAAIIKKMCPKSRIIGRSLSPIHDTVLEAMGISDIVHPEQESATRLTKKIDLHNMIETFDLDKNYSISEVKTTSEMIGKTLAELNFRDAYNLNIVTIIRKVEKTSIIGTKRSDKVVLGLPSKDTIIKEGDILVVFGKNKDIYNMTS